VFGFAYVDPTRAGSHASPAEPLSGRDALARVARSRRESVMRERNEVEGVAAIITNLDKG